jgi:diguanylate cyclase (GGDEF)-like protein
MTEPSRRRRRVSARDFEEVRRRAFFFEVLSEVSRTALETGALEEVLGRIVRYVRDKFDLALAAIVVADDSGAEWRHRAIAVRGDMKLPDRDGWPVTAGVVGRAIRTGAPQLVLDVAADPDYFGLDARVGCEYVVPIRMKGRTLGAMNLEAEAPAVFAAENLALFRTLAEQVAGPIELALVARQLEEANAELDRLSRRDALTGVANRRCFEETFDLEWRRAERLGAPIALVLADVDRFKAYNDALGHPEGDACLRRVAASFAAAAHRAGDLVARYGGEEFAVLLPGLDRENAVALAEAMRAALAALSIPHPAAPPPGRVTASFGVAAWVPRPGRGREGLVAAADAALYRAKALGRDRVEVGEEVTKPRARRGRPGASSPGS